MKLSSKLLKSYPQAKFVEAQDPDIEDDSIELTEELHIQVGQGYACLSKWDESEQTMEYLFEGKLKGAIDAALKLVEDENETSNN